MAVGYHPTNLVQNYGTHTHYGTVELSVCATVLKDKLQNMEQKEKK